MIVIAFKNKISGKYNYLSAENNSLRLTTAKAMKFESYGEAHEQYASRYTELKIHSNIFRWKKQLGINVDKPYFIEIEKED